MPYQLPTEEQNLAVGIEMNVEFASVSDPDAIAWVKGQASYVKIAMHHLDPRTPARGERVPQHGWAGRRTR